MSLILAKEIERLKKQLLSLSAVVEQAILFAIKALRDRDPELCKKVIEQDDEIDDLEVMLEEECLKILALHQPVADDLRLIVAVLKINSDLERIGDLAVNLAQRARSLSRMPAGSSLPKLLDMAEKSQDMVRKSLDSFVQRNTELALAVCAADQEVDAMHREIYEGVKSGLRSGPENVDMLIHYFGVSRQLERMADHATNIAEDVIYLCEGKIVRHRANELK